MYKVRFFRLSEFTCKCCGAGAPAAALVVALDLFRAAFGAPVIINSGFRCTQHNAKVGGSETSRHLVGAAADIRPAEATKLEEFFSLGERFFAISGWEIIKYSTFLHIGAARASGIYLWDNASVISAQVYK